MGLNVRLSVALLASASALAGCAQMPPPASSIAAPAPAPAATASDQLKALFAYDAKETLRLDPLTAVARGEPSPPGDFALTFTDRHLADMRATTAKERGMLDAIDRSALSPREQTSYAVFAENLKSIEREQSPEIAGVLEKLPMNHFGGLLSAYPTFVSGDGGAPFETVGQYEDNLARNRLLPAVFDNAILRWRQGMADGVVDTKLTTRDMIDQIDGILADPVEKSPFTGPIRKFPTNFDATTKERLTREYTAATRDQVYPAYRKLRAFLHDEYLPAARDGVGLDSLKGGPAVYRYQIEANTTLDLEPEAVHQLGLSEVARIHGEMDKVRVELGFKGDLRQFFDYVRTAPAFHPQSKEQLARAYVDVAHKIDTLVPQYFSTIPKTPLRITTYPPFTEKFEAGGSYENGAPDGGRPGTFYYNTYDFKSRFLSGVTTLYLHEAIPGHHFQISLAQEDLSLPDFQRFGGNTAYVEGWALYTETLGYPMGLYKDPIQRWGTLDDEMLRAMRLVVDTGIHAKGWTRDQAIDYMLSNSGMGKADATAEVERYTAIPGQALSYKIGALTILRLRDEAQKALGDKFDIRAFHRVVLEDGAVPMAVLEAKVHKWIAEGGD